MAISQIAKNPIPTPAAMRTPTGCSEVSSSAACVKRDAMMPVIGLASAQNDAAHGNGGGLGF